jgi:nitroreductase
MDLQEAIYSRRAVRAFTDEPVDEATLRRLIDAAIQAPSAVNQQPWTFTVVRNQAVLDAKKMLDAAGITEQRAALCRAAGQAFYNTSPFTLRDLRARASQQKAGTAGDAGDPGQDDAADRAASDKPRNPGPQ